MDQQFNLLKENVNAAHGNKEVTRGIQFAYQLHGTWYASTFPIHRAMYHKNHTGPDMCDECYDCGFVDGLFTQYCESCAKMYDNMEKRDLREVIKRKVANIKKEVVDLTMKTKRVKNLKCAKKKNTCKVDGCNMNAVRGCECYLHWEEC